ncbi:uncharacterized protein L3040_000868 [Drepanopeziza brunnea f. sp. 'multigermtubi']|uniref:uncharacterized protein n=1 Tax=Drepanopeziza brunnea f. sp. 'multigermtubi' TaxID=698441 RepID=UPI00239273C5|nr:hypothetical protein L3040_000868 [Drepanopeziza brunnea f. sp. 'multigermtubi']
MEMHVKRKYSPSTATDVCYPFDVSLAYAPPAYQQPVFLDSDGTLSQLPANLVAAMLSEFTFMSIGRDLATRIFDQDNGNLLLAQYQDCGSNTIPIGSGTDAVPLVTGACKPTSTSS